MGEMADMLIDDFEEVSCQDDGVLIEYLLLSDHELRVECKRARGVKITQIRDYPRELSNKQRYCLAKWCVKRDDREINREMISR